MQTITTTDTLDVTILEPREKHPAIFNRFDKLANGAYFILLNDHDPKPVYYQLMAERGNIFTWEYLVQGPQWWEIKITKRSNYDAELTLGQIAAKDIRKAQVFKKFGIDFCCGGKKTVKEACSEKGLDAELVEQELNSVDNLAGPGSIHYDNWGLDFLADYIVNTHHSYVRKQLPDIRAFAEKVMQVHGAQHPELIRIHQLVEEINAEIKAHLLKEERVLFPYVKELVATDKHVKSLHAAQFGSVQDPINMMEMEHEFVGKHLEEIRNISGNYTLPEDACASYSVLYRMLNAFEEDLHLHVHLENNILFPKAVALEKQLN